LIMENKPIPGNSSLLVEWQAVWPLRSELYSLFAGLLLEVPDRVLIDKSRQGFWAQFPLAAANSAMERGLHLLTTWSSGLAEEAPDSLSQLKTEFNELFIGPGKLQAPPWESIYRSDQRQVFGTATFAVREFYRQGGLQLFRQGQYPDDHLGLELLFMADLSRRMQQTDNYESLVQLQLQFLVAHPLAWIEDFCKQVRAGTSKFYGGMVLLLSGFLEWDQELLDEFQRESAQRKH
jgi:TorA maturation chaperone TorD